jgi:hypothetical protein
MQGGIGDKEFLSCYFSSFQEEAGKRFTASELLIVIWESRRNSICPRRRIREREQSERGPFA